MWQLPDSKAKVFTPTNRKTKRWVRPMHVQRVTFEMRKARPVSETLEPQAQKDSVVDARLLLNDLSPSGMGVFSSESMNQGEEVTITLAEPLRVFLRGKVAWCREQPTSGNIISEKTYEWRMGIEFIFRDDQEKAAVQKFCEDLIKTLLPEK